MPCVSASSTIILTAKIMKAVGGWESISAVSVGALPKSQLLREQHAAAEALSTIVTTLQFLTMQGLALRGHSEKSGNVCQLLLIGSRDMPELEAFCHRR